jgi:hypothetical protein
VFSVLEYLLTQRLVHLRAQNYCLMKNRIAISVLFLLLSISAFSQKKDSTASKKDTGTTRKKFALGLVLSPDYSYRTLSSDGSSVATSIIRSRDSLETAKYRYSIGISGLFEPVKNFSLETGLFYSAFGYGTIAEQLINNQGQNAGSITWNYNYYYITVPLNLGYSLHFNKFTIHANAGLVLGYWLNSTSDHILDNTNGTSSTGSQNMDPALRHLNMFFNAGIGIGYDVSNNLRILLEPTYTQSFIADVEDVQVSEYLYTIGVNIGVYYLF